MTIKVIKTKILLDKIAKSCGITKLETGKYELCTD